MRCVIKSRDFRFWILETGVGRWGAIALQEVEGDHVFGVLEASLLMEDVEAIAFG